MQKLAVFKTGMITGNQRGSALVGVVVLAIVMAIGSLGYLQVVTTSASNEIQGLNDAKAFHAAESGLLMGTRWLKQQSWPTTVGSVTTIFGGLTINGMSVVVKDSVGNAGVVVVYAIASNASALSYAKKVSWRLTQSSIPSGAYGVYFENAYELGGNTQGLRKLDYDGPVHSNTAIKLGNPGGGNESHFNSPVQVHNVDPSTNQPVYNAGNGTGHFGNDYRPGVTGGSGNWDSEFQRTYNGAAAKLTSVLDASNKTDVAINAVNTNLTFGVQGNGVAYYQYRNAAGTLVTVPYDSTVDQKLHIVNQTVSVSGTIKGKVSVYTDAGKTISIGGNLLYAGLNLSADDFTSPDTSANSGLSASSANVLGLYSGGDVRIPEGTFFVSAQIFALGSSANTVLYDNDKKNKTKLYLLGSLAVGNFWDAKQGNDQATFMQLWDRRKLSAPGIGYQQVDASGNPVTTLAISGWNENNQ